MRQRATNDRFPAELGSRLNLSHRSFQGFVQFHYTPPSHRTIGPCVNKLTLFLQIFRLARRRLEWHVHDARNLLKFVLLVETVFDATLRRDKRHR
jgi:hypothetical protein